MLLRFLLFLLFFYLVYYLLKTLVLRPFRQGFQGGNRPGNDPHARRKEGDVTVEYHKDDAAQSDPQLGEYIDYEEVDEEQKP